jgi:hypothetical protein
MELPRISLDVMHVQRWIYDYGFFQQLALCAEKTGQYQKGVEACELVLKRTDLSEDIKNKVESQLQLLQEANIKQIQNKLVDIFNGQ